MDFRTSARNKDKDQMCSSKVSPNAHEECESPRETLASFRVFFSDQPHPLLYRGHQP